MNTREEAALQRHVLRTIGSQPGVWVHPNPVGQGHHGMIYRQLMQDLDSHPPARAIVVRRLNTSRITYGLGVGSPDLVLGVDGRIGWLELKSGTGRLGGEQKTWHSAAAALGMPVRTIKSVEEAVDFVERLRRGR